MLELHYSGPERSKCTLMSKVTSNIKTKCVEKKTHTHPQKTKQINKNQKTPNKTKQNKTPLVIAEALVHHGKFDSVLEMLICTKLQG